MTTLLVVVLVGCGGAGPSTPRPQPESAPAGVATVEDAPSDDDPNAEIAEVNAAIEAIDVVGLVAWEDAVRPILVAHYDDDGSGELDTRVEVDHVACETWRTVDATFAEHTNDERSIRAAYGFAPATFFLERLGVDRSMRERLRETLLDCGIRD